jgi:hypothetical protein
VLAGTTPILVHNVNNNYSESCPVVAAALKGADAATALPSRVRPAVSEALETRSGAIYQHTSGAPGGLDNEVTDVIDQLSLEERGVGHGGCGLARCISDALANGDDPTGGRVAAVTIRSSVGHDLHGIPVGPCPSCVPLVEKYGLEFVDE